MPTTIVIFIVGGTLFGLGIGVIMGYYLGQRSRVRDTQAGFPIATPQPPRDVSKQ